MKAKFIITRLYIVFAFFSLWSFSSHPYVKANDTKSSEIFWDHLKIHHFELEMYVIIFFIELHITKKPF